MLSTLFSVTHPSFTHVDQSKQLKLESCNFHCTVPHPFSFAG